jgi:hypothetical protein
MKLERMFCAIPTPFVVEAEEVLGENSMTEWVRVFAEGRDRSKRCIDAEREYPKMTDLVLALDSDKTKLSGARTERTPGSWNSPEIRREANP